MAIPPTQSVVASNREAWNDSAKHHKNTDAWRALLGAVGQADFSCFDPILTHLLLSLGVEDKNIVQLGCNNGRECLSLLGLGARTVVGVDQSAAFLAQARELASLSPHDPVFVEADIHSLPPALHDRFDTALITIGVLNWMPDIAVFFSRVGDTLRQGGTLVIYETHPFLEMFAPETVDPFRLAESYFRTEPFVEERVIVYEGQSQAKGAPSYWFVHRLSDIVTALIEAGLQIAHFKEYPHSNREGAYDLYQHQKAQLPMCYTLTAIKR